jgi:hypothetical protein
MLRDASDGLTKKDRISNALAETWFEIVKNLILKNNLNLKCGRFISAIEGQIRSIIKSYKYKSPKKFDRKRKRIEREKWGRKGNVKRRRTAAGTYFD